MLWKKYNSKNSGLWSWNHINNAVDHNTSQWIEIRGTNFSADQEKLVRKYLERLNSGNNIMKPTRNLLHIICSVLLVLFFSTHTYGQKGSSAPDIQEKLRAITTTMYEQGNANFLLVEALADSVIQEDSGFFFACRACHVTFNDKELSGLLQKKYDSLAYSFYQKNDAVMLTGGATSYISITLKDVLDSNSELRRSRVSESNFRDIIVAEMVADKLVDAVRIQTIIYSIKGITIDGKPLTSSFEAKYEKRFKELVSDIPGHNGDILTIHSGKVGPCTAPKR